eukprot:966121-Prorocentrum_minimum.AAC.1
MCKSVESPPPSANVSKCAGLSSRLPRPQMCPSVSKCASLSSRLLCCMQMCPNVQVCRVASPAASCPPLLVNSPPPTVNSPLLQVKLTEELLATVDLKTIEGEYEVRGKMPQLWTLGMVDPTPFTGVGRRQEER